MPFSRMDDFRVAIDPRTGELRSASKTFSGPRGLRVTGAGFNWRPLAIGSAVLFALVAGVFLVPVGAGLG
mgnify:CR=1 FL=1